jgi:methylaspartate mutase epsilon subunit
MMIVLNKKWSIEKFLSVRKEVLASWPTGLDQALDLDQSS